MNHHQYDQLKNLNKEQLINLIQQKEPSIAPKQEKNLMFFYEQLFEFSPDALLLINTENKAIERCSERAVELFGFTEKSSLIGKDESEFYKDDVDVDNDRVDEIEYVKHLDNTSFWGLRQVRQFQFEGICYFLIRITDITEKKSVEQNLVFDKARLKMLIEYTDDLVWSIDQDKYVTEFNSKAKAIVKDFAGVEIKLNQPFFPAHTKYSSRKEISWKNYFSRALSGEKFTVQYFFHHADKDQYYEFHFHPIRHNNHEVIGATIFGRDISDRKEQQERLRYTENLYKSVVNTQHEMICRFKPNTQITFVNHASVRNLGKSTDQLIGRKFLELIPSEEKLSFAKKLKQTAKEGKPSAYKYMIEALNGQRYWHYWTIIPVYSHDGILEEFQAAGLDITSKTMAEQKLKASEEKFRTLVLAAPVGIFLTNREGYCTWTNKRLQEIGDFTFEDALGDGLFKNLHPEDKLEIFRLWQESKDNDILFHKKVECRYLLNSGGIRWIYVTFTPLTSEDKRIIGFVGIVEDVTDRKKYEIELINTKGELEKALKTKDEFLSVMSHEIRTPLNAIIGLSHLMVEQDHLPAQEEGFSTLTFSANHLLTLVNDILDFSKLQAGKLKLEYIPFNISELIKHTVKLFDAQVKEKEVSLILEISENFPTRILGDPTRVSQILNNLLSNAVKFTEKGQIKVSLNKTTKGQYSIIVKDSGIGMTEEEQGQIFEAFTQANSSTNRKYGGTGLGLTITRELVSLQGGTLEMKSKSGDGTKFMINLPLNIADSQSHLDHEDHLTEKELKGLNILYVEDINPNQFLMKSFCDHWGITLDLASNGEEAMKKLTASQRYDIILMDIMMPVMDGYETAAHIREMEGDYFKQVPIIAVTASVSNKEAKKYLKFGMNDFLEKPIRPRDLVQKLTSNLPGNHTKAKTYSERGSKNMFALLDEYHAQNPKEYITLLESSHNYIHYYRKLILSAIDKKRVEDYHNQSHNLINLLAHLKQDEFIKLLRNNVERIENDTVNLRRDLEKAFEKTFSYLEHQTLKSKNLLK